MVKTTVLAMTLACMAGVSSADVMLGLNTDKQIVYDSQWKSTSLYNDGNWYFRTGLGAVTIRRASEFVLQLPTVSDPNLTFTSGDFRVQMLSKTGATDSSIGPNPVPTFNLDLYAVRVSDTSTVLASDFYAGAADTKATLIQDNFITPDSPIRVTGNPNYSTTNDAADAKLVAFLNEAYAKGANAGKYVFIRLSPDYSTVTSDMANMNYTVVTGKAGTASEKPTITYTTVVPEPIAVSLIPLAGGLVLMARQRERK